MKLEKRRKDDSQSFSITGHHLPPEIRAVFVAYNSQKNIEINTSQTHNIPRNPP